MRRREKRIDQCRQRLEVANRKLMRCHEDDVELIDELKGDYCQDLEILTKLFYLRKQDDG